MTAVLVVEDDPDIAEVLRMFLTKEGWETSTASDGPKALALSRSISFDVVLLDVGLRGEMSGFDICREIRGYSDVPVVFITARDDEVDRVLGLELGADDYVTKPFSGREVVARIKAILRRGRSEGVSNTVQYGTTEIDIAGKRVTVAGEEIQLTARELSLLMALVEDKGLALSREQLLDAAWGLDWIGDIRTVDVHVRQLRKKIGDDLPLQTVRGFGYRLD